MTPASTQLRRQGMTEKQVEWMFIVIAAVIVIGLFVMAANVEKGY